MNNFAEFQRKGHSSAGKLHWPGASLTVVYALQLTGCGFLSAERGALESAELEHVAAQTLPHDFLAEQHQNTQVPQIPPIEDLYRKYTGHFLGVADFCHEDNTIRQRGAEVKARYTLARSIRVAVASELIWQKLEKATSGGTLKEIFCRYYVEVVDEPLGVTQFSELATYSNSEGLPCVQMLATLPVEDWFVGARAYPWGQSVSSEDLRTFLLERDEPNRIRELAHKLGISGTPSDANLSALCVPEDPND